MSSNSIRMAADSTQVELSGKKRKKTTRDLPPRHRPKKIKKGTSKTNKESKRKRGEEDSECESDLDLEKPLMAIGHYIKSREEMVEHMFRSISQVKLRGILPDILKSIPLEELKVLSVGQLEIMSKKRIRRILDGDDPDAISSSGTEDSSESEEEGAHTDPVGDAQVHALQQNDVADKTPHQEDAEELAVADQVHDEMLEPCNQQHRSELTSNEVVDVTDDAEQPDYQEQPSSPYTSPPHSTGSRLSYCDDSDSSTTDAEDDSDLETATESDVDPDSEPEEGELVEEKPRKKRKRRKKPTEAVKGQGDDEKVQSAEIDAQVVEENDSFVSDPGLHANVSSNVSSGEANEVKPTEVSASDRTLHTELCGHSADVLAEPSSESVGTIHEEPPIDSVDVKVEHSKDCAELHSEEDSDAPGGTNTELPAEETFNLVNTEPHIDSSNITPSEELKTEYNVDSIESEPAGEIGTEQTNITPSGELKTESNVDSIESEPAGDIGTGQTIDSSNDITPHAELKEESCVNSPDNGSPSEVATQRTVDTSAHILPHRESKTESCTDSPAIEPPVEVVTERSDESSDNTKPSEELKTIQPADSVDVAGPSSELNAGSPADLAEGIKSSDEVITTPVVDSAENRVSATKTPGDMKDSTPAEMVESTVAVEVDVTTEAVQETDHDEQTQIKPDVSEIQGPNKPTPDTSLGECIPADGTKDVTSSEHSDAEALAGDYVSPLETAVDLKPEAITEKPTLIVKAEVDEGILDITKVDIDIDNLKTDMCHSLSKAPMSSGKMEETHLPTKESKVLTTAKETKSENKDRDSAKKHKEKKRDASKRRHGDSKRRKSSRGSDIGKATSEASSPQSNFTEAVCVKTKSAKSNTDDVRVAQEEAKSEKRKQQTADNTDVTTKKRRSDQTSSPVKEQSSCDIDITTAHTKDDVDVKLKEDHTHGIKRDTKATTIAEHVAAAVIKARSESRRQNKENKSAEHVAKAVIKARSESRRQSKEHTSAEHVAVAVIKARGESRHQSKESKSSTGSDREIERHAHSSKMYKTEKTDKHDHDSHRHDTLEHGERQITLIAKNVIPNKHKMLMDDFKCTVAVTDVGNRTFEKVKTSPEADQRSKHHASSQESHKLSEMPREASKSHRSREKKELTDDRDANSHKTTHHTQHKATGHKHKTHHHKNSSRETSEHAQSGREQKSHRSAVVSESTLQKETKSHKHVKVSRASVEGEHSSKDLVPDENTSIHHVHRSHKSHKSETVKQTMLSQEDSPPTVCAGEVSKRTITITQKIPGLQKHDLKSRDDQTSTVTHTKVNIDNSSVHTSTNSGASPKAASNKATGSNTSASTSVVKINRPDINTSRNTGTVASDNVKTGGNTSSKSGSDSTTTKTDSKANTSACESTSPLTGDGGTSTQSAVPSSAKTSDGGAKRRTIKIARKQPVDCPDSPKKAGGDLKKKKRTSSKISSEAAKVKSSLSTTQREILELEMRARAIKAMLNSQEMKEVKRIQTGKPK